MAERRWEDLNCDCLALVFERVGLKHLLLDIPLVCKSWCKALKILSVPYFDATPEQRQCLPELIAKLNYLENLRICGFELSGVELNEIVTQIGVHCSNFVGLFINSSIDIEEATS
ncbi:hypothetical protein IFM89_037899 [Coptis chinensis]|uniref:F-box/LRR-repeat protein n=1 Tax=Coptis chinensis TaxID=261450 RepID=A0A835HXS3_9MAGN|nr:hypothetical protein IFM89_037899 [Coptis chinensis]